jgi:hypothetical protein
MPQRAIHHRSTLVMEEKDWVLGTARTGPAEQRDPRTKPTWRFSNIGARKMIRLIAVAAFALAIATSAQAMSLAPLHQADGIDTQVRELCGAGYQRIRGVCVRNTTVRQVRRCARWHAGVCVVWH